MKKSIFLAVILSLTGAGLYAGDAQSSGVKPGDMEKDFLMNQILPEVDESDLLKASLKGVRQARHGASGGWSTLVIGHRGFGQETSPELESTVPALRRGFAMGAGAVEFDVNISKDGALMLTHNSDIDDVSTAKGCVADLTRAQLQAAPLIDGSGNVSSSRMAVLEDALELLHQQVAGGNRNPIVAQIHIKIFDGFHGDWPGARRLVDPCPVTDPVVIARKTINAVKKAGLADRVMFVSFDYRVLDTIRAIKSDAKVGLLSVRRSRPISVAAARGYDAVSLQHSSVRKEDVERARSLGLQMYVWTPTTTKALSDFMTPAGDVGMVDGVVTNSIPNAVALAR